MSTREAIASPEDMEYFKSLVGPETRSANQVAASLTKRDWYNLLSMATGWLSNPTGDPQEILATKHLLEDVLDQVFRHDMGCRWSLREAMERMLDVRTLLVRETEGANAAWIETYSGVQFYPLNPNPLHILIADIAHALSNLCRFGGHTGWFYSVAQHSVLVSRACPPALALEGLLHDAAEAYLTDLPRPIKKTPVMAAYRAAEAKLQEVIAQAYALAQPLPEEVESADKLLLVTESRDLMQFLPADWKYQEKNGYPVLPGRIVPLDAIDAEQLFLDEFDRIMETRDQGPAEKRES